MLFRGFYSFMEGFQRTKTKFTYILNKLKHSIWHVLYGFVGPFYKSKVHDGILVSLSSLSFKIFCYFIMLGNIFHYYSSAIPNYAKRG